MRNRSLGWAPAAAVLIAAAHAAPAWSAERAGTVHVVRPHEHVVVIDDVSYRVAPGLVVQARGRRGVAWSRALEPGQPVRFVVTGEAGGRRGVVTEIELTTGAPNASTE